MNLGKDVIQISDLDATWSKANGTTFIAGAAFNLGGMAISSDATVKLDPEGSLKNVELKNFKADKLWKPFEDITIEKADFNVEDGKNIHCRGKTDAARWFWVERPYPEKVGS